MGKEYLSWIKIRYISNLRVFFVQQYDPQMIARTDKWYSSCVPKQKSSKQKKNAKKKKINNPPYQALTYSDD